MTLSEKIVERDRQIQELRVALKEAGAVLIKADDVLTSLTEKSHSTPHSDCGDDCFVVETKKSVKSTLSNPLIKEAMDER